MDNPTTHSGATASTQVVRRHFQSLLDALTNVEKSLQEQTARSVAAGDYATASRCMDKAKGVHVLLSDIRTRLQDWSRLQLDPVGPNPPVVPRPHPHPAPRSELSVTLEGEVIPGETAADVFVATLEKIGLERIMLSGEKLSGIPLVSKSHHGDYQSIRRSGYYYICTHSNNVTKKRTLEKLARLFSLRVEVKIHA
jgi:hypothetical protein